MQFTMYKIYFQNLEYLNIYMCYGLLSAVTSGQEKRNIGDVRKVSSCLILFYVFTYFLKLVQ